MRAEPEWDTASGKGEDAKEQVAPDKLAATLDDKDSEPDLTIAEDAEAPVLRADRNEPDAEVKTVVRGPVRFGRPKIRRSARKANSRLISPLTRKVLAVNFIAVLIPIVGFLSLGEYRDSLIATEMEALKTQGEVFAGAIGEGAIATTLSGDQILDIPPAQQIVRRLSESNAVRARLFLPDGDLAADSRLLVAGGGVIHIQVLPPPSLRRPLLDPIVDILDWLPRRHDLEAYREAPMQSAADYTEVMNALRGETSNELRQTDIGDYVLSVAVPVQRYRQVLGALMLSKNGDDIDREVRELRFFVLQLFAVALAITTLLSIYLAGTIARPVRRLAEAAEKVRRDIGRQTHTIPDLTGRRDEIGDLSGSFRAMTQELQAQLDAIERFAADVSHELKNPLTSLRSAVETAARVKDQGKQRQLLAIVQDDVRRLDRLITDIADASRLDAELSRAQSAPVDIAAMLTTLADMHRTTSTGKKKAPEVVLDLERQKGLTVSGMEDRLVQIFHNLLGNAVSFSPAGGKIRLIARLDGNIVETLIEDEGPGLPEGKLEAIFDRFYSERPSGEKFGTHSGLGLSISKQIVEAHRGTIRAENIPGPSGKPAGARFIVRLPYAEGDEG